MNNIIELPDEHLKYIAHEIVDSIIQIQIESTRTEAFCPYCGMVSNKVHSRYMRKLQDLPIQGKKVKLLLMNRKYFCTNDQCTHKTFAEQFGFYEPNSYRTNRLQEEIMRVSITQSSIAASKYLRRSVADICKSSICNMLKKNKAQENPE